MSCELRRCRLRSMTGARCPSLRRPSWPAARPTIGSPPCGYTCGLASRSARGATISPSGSHAATHDQARNACPVLGGRERPRRHRGTLTARSRDGCDGHGMTRAQHRTRARHRRCLPQVITPAVPG